jgi:FixJ family two-component response regulator
MLSVILITGHGDVPMAVQAMKDSALDFLSKPFRDQDLLDRINAALEQDATNRRTLEQRQGLARRTKSLTPREREVMALVVDGRANKVITIDLGLSERTIEIPAPPMSPHDDEVSAAFSRIREYRLRRVTA